MKITNARSSFPSCFCSSPWDLCFAKEEKNDHHQEDEKEADVLSGSLTQVPLVAIVTTTALGLNRSMKTPTLFFMPFFHFFFSWTKQQVELLAMAAVASASKAATIFARYREKGEKRKWNEKEGGTLCNSGKGPSFVSFFFFNTLCCFQTPRIWPCLGSTPKRIVHGKQITKHQNRQAKFFSSKSKPRSANEQYLQPKQNSCKNQLVIQKPKQTTQHLLLTQTPIQNT